MSLMNCLLWNKSQENRPGVNTPLPFHTNHNSDAPVHWFRDRLMRASLFQHRWFIHSCLPRAAIRWQPLTPYKKPESFKGGQELWWWVSKEICVVALNIKKYLHLGPRLFSERPRWMWRKRFWRWCECRIVSLYFFPMIPPHWYFFD